MREPISLEELNGLLQEVGDWSLELEKNVFELKVTEWLNRAMTKVKQEPFELKNIQEVINVLKLNRGFEIYPNLWEAQNIIYGLKQELLPPLLEKIKLKSKDISLWQSSFQKLGTLLRVAIS